jgi:predicted kinase
VLEALRKARREHRSATGTATLAAAAAERSGALVIEADRIGKSYDGRAPSRRTAKTRQNRAPGPSTPVQIQ